MRCDETVSHQLQLPMAGGLTHKKPLTGATVIVRQPVQLCASALSQYIASCQSQLVSTMMSQPPVSLQRRQSRGSSWRWAAEERVGYFWPLPHHTVSPWIDLRLTIAASSHRLTYLLHPPSLCVLLFYIGPSHVRVGEPEKEASYMLTTERLLFSFKICVRIPSRVRRICEILGGRKNTDQIHAQLSKKILSQL